MYIDIYRSIISIMVIQDTARLFTFRTQKYLVLQF